jgi:hypothetical protein
MKSETKYITDILDELFKNDYLFQEDKLIPETKPLS